MGKVIAAAVMSLDGYIAKRDNTIGRLFDWYMNGDVECPTASPDITFHISPKSVNHWRTWVSSLGALVCGRTLFDFTNGWDGHHTMDVPVIVITHRVPTDWVDDHPGAPFSFVTDGVQAAIEQAQAIAGDRCCSHRRHHRSTVPRARAARRGGDRPGAGRHGRGTPIVRQARWRRCPARRPDGVHPRRAGHPPRVPGEAMNTESPMSPTPVGTRTIHVGLRVSDRRRSLDFYRSLGYEVVGTVPETEIGHLTMLKLPGDEFVTIAGRPARRQPARPQPHRRDGQLAE